jgi:hypothetical protein
MKANELRIGNWVMVFPVKHPQQVCDVMFDSVNTESVFGQHYGEVDPIPLTEDWLLKFGFVSNPYEDRYEKGTIHIECDKTKGATYLWIENMPHIKYVHQLQNLYFALTGEELTYEREKQ